MSTGDKCLSQSGIKQSSFCEHCGSIPLLRTINLFIFLFFYAAAAALNIVFLVGLPAKVDWLLINRKSD
jgi:hypothetical protein